MSQDDFRSPWDFTIPGTLLAALRAARSVVLMTHRGPDGDGLGSELALLAALSRMGKDARVLNSDSVPARYRFLDPKRVLKVYGPRHRRAVHEADLVLLVDTAETERAGTPAAVRAKTERPILAIDHHPPNGNCLSGFIASDAASTAEMVFALLTALDCPITPPMADALYAGIVFDTQSFRFIRNNDRPLRIAAELLNAGADAERVQNELFRHPPHFPLLLGRILPKLSLTVDDQVAVLIATNQDMAGLDLKSDEVREVVNLVNSMRGVRVCAFVRERGDRTWRVNLRSVPGYPVDALAREWSGGGHTCAAGATLEAMEEDAVQTLLEARLAEIVRAKKPAPRERRQAP